MIRLHAAYGGTILCRTFKNMKKAKQAFANRILDRSYPDYIELTLNGNLVARWF